MVTHMWLYLLTNILDDLINYPITFTSSGHQLFEHETIKTAFRK